MHHIMRKSGAGRETYDSEDDEDSNTLSWGNESVDQALEEALNSTLKELEALTVLRMFFESSWTRMNGSLRNEERKEIEDFAPTYITLEALHQHERTRQAQGANTYNKLRETKSVEEDSRRSTVRSSVGLSRSTVVVVERYRKCLSLELTDKIEMITTEIRLYKIHVTMATRSMEKRIKRQKFETQEHKDHLRELRKQRDRFRYYTESRARVPKDLVNTLVDKSNEAARRNLYDASGLRRFHREMIKSFITKRGILDLANENLKSNNARMKDVVRRKRDNKEGFTEYDIEMVQIEFEVLLKENERLDKELKDTHKLNNETIYNHRNAEKALRAIEEKNKSLMKDMRIRSDSIRKMETSRESVKADMVTLKADYEAVRILRDEYKKPNTEDYIAITSRTRRKAKEIQNMKTKVKIAELGLKRAHEEQAALMRRKSRKVILEHAREAAAKKKKELKDANANGFYLPPI